MRLKQIFWLYWDKQKYRFEYPCLNYHDLIIDMLMLIDMFGNWKFARLLRRVKLGWPKTRVEHFQEELKYHYPHFQKELKYQIPHCTPKKEKLHRATGSPLERQGLYLIVE